MCNERLLTFCGDYNISYLMLLSTTDSKCYFQSELSYYIVVILKDYSFSVLLVFTSSWANIPCHLTSFDCRLLGHLYTICVVVSLLSTILLNIINDFNFYDILCSCPLIKLYSHAMKFNGARKKLSGNIHQTLPVHLWHGTCRERFLVQIYCAPYCNL